MNSIKYLTQLGILAGAAAYFISLSAIAAPPLLDAGQVATGNAPPIMEILKADPKSVSGTLQYKQGINLETLVFGEKTGLYGTGLVLHSSALPGEMGQLFKGKHALQIALGNAPGTDKIPQFGSVTLIFNRIPTKAQTFKTVFPKPPFPGENIALILFSSPQSPRTRNDEDRLKGSFFAQNGTITLTPIGKPQTVMAPHRGEQVAFKTQTFRLEFNSLLVTPFTNEGADLKGNLELPVFWPDGKESESLIKRLTYETLGSPTSPLVAPESVPHHNREVTGSTKKPKQ